MFANWTVNEDRNNYVNLSAIGYPDRHMDDRQVVVDTHVARPRGGLTSVLGITTLQSLVCLVGKVCMVSRQESLCTCSSTSILQRLREAQVVENHVLEVQTAGNAEASREVLDTDI